jgi:hypothetical protein
MLTMALQLLKHGAEDVRILGLPHEALQLLQAPVPCLQNPCMAAPVCERLISKLEQPSRSSLAAGGLGRHTVEGHV